MPLGTRTSTCKLKPDPGPVSGEPAKHGLRCVSTSPAIAVETLELGFQYAGGRSVFRDVSFSLPHPGLHAVFGRSGTGKTTLARLLASQLQPSSGIVRTHLPRLRYCYSGERLPAFQRTGDHLDRVTPKERQQDLKEMMSEFGVDDGILLRGPLQVSSGQHSRLNILRYLVQDWDILIIDEALSGIDDPTRERILRTIKQRFASRTVLYVSHHIFEVAAFAQRILTLRSAASGTTIQIADGCNGQEFSPAPVGLDAVVADLKRNVTS